MAIINGRGRVGIRRPSAVAGPSIVLDGLKLYLDASKTTSYAGTGTVWTDLSGNGNNGTLVNGPTYSSANGGVIGFDGQNDYVTSPNLNISGNVPITISFWCNHLSNQSNDVVSVFYGTCGSSYNCVGLYYRNSSNYVRFTTWQSSPGDYDTSFVKDFNTWHHWTIVYSNNTVLVYRDGVADANGAQSRTISFTSTKLSIGSTLTCGAPSNIRVGSVLLYNRALSSSEVAQNFLATVGNFYTYINSAPPIVFSSLKLYLDAAKTASYPGTGTAWIDLSGNGNAGTLTNGPIYSSAGGGSIVFDGSDDFISTNLIPTIGTGNISYSIWFKTSASQTGGLIGVRSVGAIQCVLVICNSVGAAGTNLYMSSNDGSIVRVGSTTKTWADNKWHHAVMVHTSTSDTLYVDGVFEKQNTSSAMNINNVQKLLVGCNPNGNTYLSNWGFNGSIANSQVYSQALTAAEALQNFNALKSKFYPQVSDADAQSFIYATGIQDATQASAVNALVTSLKSAGIWTKMKAIYPFVGGSAASHKWNLKDPRDLNAAYRLTFGGTGWVHSSTGAKPNGVSDYTDTFLNPSTAFADFKNNGHLSIYSRTQNPIGSGWNIGVGNAEATGDPLWGLAIKRPTWSTYTNPIIYDFGNYSGNGRLITTYNDARGFWIGSTIASNNHKIYRNGAAFATSTNVATGTISNGNFYLGKINNTSGSSNYGLDNELSLVSIGDGLTDAESAALYTAVQSFQTSLGRQV